MEGSKIDQAPPDREIPKPDNLDGVLMADELRPLAVELNRYAVLVGNLVKTMHDQRQPHGESPTQVRAAVAAWREKGLPVLVSVLNTCLAVYARDQVMAITESSGRNFTVGIRLEDEYLPKPPSEGGAPTNAPETEA